MAWRMDLYALSTLLLVLIVGVYLILLLTSRSKSKLEPVIESLLAVVLLAAALFYYKYAQYASAPAAYEMFANAPRPGGVSDILNSVLGGETVITTEPVGSTGLLPMIERQVVGVVKDTPVEDITNIVRGLTLYYSTFSKDSYTKASRTWTNISPLLKDGSTCPDVPFDRTHLQMLNAPADELRKGVYLGTNVLTGPKSYHMGIDGNASFSFFALLNLDIANNQQITEYELLKTFANTDNNNGFSVLLALTDPSQSRGRVRVSIGSKVIESAVITLRPDLTYFIAVVKVNGAFTVAVSSEQNPSDLQKPMEVMRVQNIEDIDFTNKEMQMNRRANIAGRLYATGFYNRALSSDDLLKLSTHLFGEMKKASEEYLQYQYTLNTLKAQLDLLKVCPLPGDICTACSEVQDWSNFFTVINTAREPCLKAISTFCDKNPTHSYCMCWNPAYPLTNSSVCQNVRNYFKIGIQPNVDLNNLTDTQLAFVRSKYMDSICPRVPAPAPAPAPGNSSSPPPPPPPPATPVQPELEDVELQPRDTTRLPILSVDEDKYSSVDSVPDRVTRIAPGSRRIPRLLQDVKVLGEEDDDMMRHHRSTQRHIERILDNRSRSDHIGGAPDMMRLREPEQPSGFWSWLLGRSSGQ